MYHCTHIKAPQNAAHPHDPAIVFLHEDLIETSTEKQLQAMMTHQHIQHIRVMPDCHVGHGCCIGFTAHVDLLHIVPSYVGGDIGCGVLTYPMGVSKLNLTRTERLIKATVPMGGGHFNVHSDPPIEPSFLGRYLEKAQRDAVLFSSLRSLPPPPTLDLRYFGELCAKIDIDETACMCAFGTLGSGNHFIEVNVDAESGEHFLTVHSGSRAFGMKLFEYHNGKVDAAEKCLLGEDSLQYCYDLMVAQHLAVMNRHIMLQLILRELDIDFIEDSVIESIHNYIDFQQQGEAERGADQSKRETNILRKGAISAKMDELCIVALNMRDGILLCRGRGNEDWNYSCAHGCGRIMSRAEARRRIKLKDYRRAMQDVVSSSVGVETLDEAPQAYKDMDVIVAALGPSVHVERRLAAVINLKGGD